MPSSDNVTVLVSQLVQCNDPASRKVDRLVSVSSADSEVGGLDVDSSQTQCRPSSSKLSALAPLEDQISRVDADRKVLGTHFRYSDTCSTGTSSPIHTPSLFTVNDVVGDHLVTALIDSGCDVECLLSTPCAERLGIVRSPSSFKVERWGGSLCPLQMVTQQVTLNLGGQLDCK
jgi:hypothetical protein